MTNNLPDDTDLLRYLIQVAKEDGIVDESESNFIAALNVEIKRYRNEFQNAIEDGEIDSTEHANLFVARLAILKKAMDTVREDFKITNEERRLLDELNLKLDELRALEERYQQ
ncbi:MAG: hypothetical protein ACXAD7_21160 [Candidatus Kariarchaeaceae archaeon]|jgi:hypothetical protein